MRRSSRADLKQHFRSFRREAATAGILGFLPDHASAKMEPCGRRPQRKQALKELTPKCLRKSASSRRSTRTLPRLHHRRGLDPGRLCRNLYVRRTAAKGVVQFGEGVRLVRYAPPAAVGRCGRRSGAAGHMLVGDGGFSFLWPRSFGGDAHARVVFLFWNNDGYGKSSLHGRIGGSRPEGVKPSAPDFLLTAKAYGLPAERLATVRICRALSPCGVRRAFALSNPPERTAGATA